MTQTKYKLDFLNEIEEEYQRTHGEAVQLPGGYYCEEADCYFYFEEDVPHYAERIDEWVTAYMAFDEERVIGLELKGIKELCGNGTVKAFIHNFKKPLRLSLLLLCRFQTIPEDPDEKITEGYRDLVNRFFTSEMTPDEAFV